MKEDAMFRRRFLVVMVGAVGVLLGFPRGVRA